MSVSIVLSLILLRKHHTEFNKLHPLNNISAGERVLTKKCFEDLILFADYVNEQSEVLTVTDITWLGVRILHSGEQTMK
jgi:hypothetical protein